MGNRGEMFSGSSAERCRGLNRRNRALLAGAVVTISAVLSATVWIATADRSDPAQVARGGQIYAVHCASCHGAGLEGQPNWQTPLPGGRMPAPPHDATGHTWHHSDVELFRITKDGMAAIVPGYISDMPQFKGVLTDDEIIAVIAFIKGSWRPQEGAYQEARNRERE